MSQKTISSDKIVITGLSHTINTRTRYSKNTKPYYIDIRTDFTGCSVRKVLEWAARERVIKFQKQLRLMESEEKFSAFMELGDRVDIFALEAGLSPELHTDRDEIIEILTNKD